MQTQLPVIRTYTGPDRASAQEAYRRDAQQARQTGWHAVAHRWRVVDGQQELAVVFQPAASTVDEPETVDAPFAAVPEAPLEATMNEADVGAEAEAETPVGAVEAEAADVGAEAEAETPVGAVEAEAADAAEAEAETPVGAVEAEAADAAEEEAVSAEEAVGADAEPVGAGEPSAAAVDDDPPAATSPTVDEPDTAAEPEPRERPTTPSQPASGARAHARMVIETIDLHAGGEPLRLIRSGYPRVPSAPILERRRWVREHADAVRRAIIHEPRGHRDMYGAVLLPAHRPDADIAVLFLHNEGYSTMCGHGIIALATGLLEEGLYPATAPTTTIRWETPAGLVTSTSEVSLGPGGRVAVSGVRFRNVPGYLHARDLLVPLGTLGPPGVAAARAHLAFGGAYYGIVDAADLGVRVTRDAVPALRTLGTTLTARLREDHAPTHPTDPDLGFVYGTIIVDHDPASLSDGLAPDADLRSITVFADAEVDRSPCGSGTSALLAWLHATGRRAVGDHVRNASVTGAVFDGRIEETATVGDRDGVVTSIAGTGYVTGYHTFVVDERDPLGDGFLLA
ncbi:MAG: proline racemase family protein [Chloroflexi bacterium]|nr:proline racemase family protein [Chloroflexota bacterium]